MACGSFRAVAAAVLMGGVLASAGPVSWYGKLQVVGNRIKNEAKTQNVQLKGPSLFWSTADGEKFYGAKTVDWFVESMDVSVIRAAMAIRYYKANSEPIYASWGDFGYLSTEEPNAKAMQLERIEKVIQAAIQNDIYVIVDWHSHNAETETSDAASFFGSMAAKYKDYPNIIWEIYNEPVNASWYTIQSYASTVIQAIRNAGSSNLIVVGTPSYSSQPNQVTNGLSSYSNIAYSLHFYAASHGSDYRSNAETAMNNGYAVFVTEWGTTNYDGDGTPSASATSQWTSWMDQYSVSSCNWSVSDLGQSSAMFDSLKFAASGYQVSSLSASGQLFYNYVRTNVAPPSGYPVGENMTVDIVEGGSKTWSLNDLAATSGASITSASTVGADSGTVSFSGSSLTYQSPSADAPGTVRFNYTLTLNGHVSLQRITVNIQRHPVFRDTVLEVSWAKSISGNMVTLGAKDPDGDSVSISNCGQASGSLVFGSDKKTFTYTPASGYLAGAASRDDIVSCTVVGGSLSTTSNVTFRVREYAPTVYATRSFSTDNTVPLALTLSLVRANDKDGDSMYFQDVIVAEGYPGTVTLAADLKSFVFTPPVGQVGTVPLLYTVTDGKYTSNVGTGTVTVTGTGTPIANLHPGMPTIQAATKWNAGTLLLEAPLQGNYVVESFSVATGVRHRVYAGQLSAGSNALHWNAAPGMYVVRVKGPGSSGWVARVAVR